METEWWKHAVIYQIYPRSFQDSTGDGVGDLKGIIARVPYLASLGVDIIWLSPIFKSPMKDFGYDVSDFRDIDPIFGTHDDFKELVDVLHQAGLRILIDIIPNHTSDHHEWFQKSQLGGNPKDNIYSDYYIWSDGKKDVDGSYLPPNNWLSNFGGSAWTWYEPRRQFYYHQYAVEQPDLNFRNPRVQQEMIDILQFWLDQGVDGFRVDAIDALFEVEDLSLDEPIATSANVQPNEYKYHTHIYTSKLPEVHDVTRQWRTFFNKYEEKTGKHVAMILETRDQKHRDATYWREYHTSGADAVYDFAFLHELKPEIGGIKLRTILDAVMHNVPDHSKYSPSWVVGSHDTSRIATRMGEDFVNAINMLLLLLPGSATCYYGDELGVKDRCVSYEETQDPKGISYGPVLYKKYSRDKCRNPMPWNSETNAGFSKAEKTWLPLHTDYKKRNVEVQSNTQNSFLVFFKDILKLRKNKVVRHGDFQYGIVNENIISFVRQLTLGDCFLIILNLGSQPQKNDYSAQFLGLKNPNVSVVLATPESGYSKGELVSLKTLELKRGDGIALHISMN